MLELEQIDQILPDEIEILLELKKGGQKLALKGKKDDKIVAVKVYDSNCSLQRIRREIKAMMKVESEFVVNFYEYQNKITSFNDQEEIIYTLEEFVEGEELGDILSSGHTFENEEVINFLDSLLSALEEIWTYNIVHRDIKPGNIIIREDNSPIIIDFGIARHIDETDLTKTFYSQGPCTPAFAPPEVLQNKKNLIDCRSDLFSLGIVAYMMLTGKHPIWDDSKGYDENRENMINVQISSLEGEFGLLGKYIHTLVQLEPFKRFRNPKIARNFLNKMF